MIHLAPIFVIPNCVTSHELHLLSSATMLLSHFGTSRVEPRVQASRHVVPQLGEITFDPTRSQNRSCFRPSCFPTGLMWWCLTISKSHLRGHRSSFWHPRRSHLKAHVSHEISPLALLGLGQGLATRAGSLGMKRWSWHSLGSQLCSAHCSRLVAIQCCTRCLLWLRGATTPQHVRCRERS